MPLTGYCRVNLKNIDCEGAAFSPLGGKPSITRIENEGKMGQLNFSSPHDRKWLEFLPEYLNLFLAWPNKDRKKGNRPR